MSSILKVKDKDGKWIDIPAIIGLSAYEVAVKHGYDGTEEEWLESLKGTTPHIGENGNWFFGDIDSGVKADWEGDIDTINSTLRNHDAFINAEMPAYLGELRDLVNNAPKDSNGQIIKAASKESVEAMKDLFPKDAEGNPKEVASKEDVMVEVTRLNLIESTNDGMKIYTPTEIPEGEPVENLPMLDSESMAIVCNHTLPCSFTLRIIFLPTSSSWVSINGIRYTEANQDIVFDNVTGIVEIENPSNVPIQISNLKAYLPLKTDVGNIKAEVGNISTALDELHEYAQELVGGEQ